LIIAIPQQPHCNRQTASPNLTSPSGTNVFFPSTSYYSSVLLSLRSSFGSGVAAPNGVERSEAKGWKENGKCFLFLVFLFFFCFFVIVSWFCFG
jgi:hypothetical protein